MPVADIDIWRAANILLKRHGKDAAIEAARRADEMLAQGDLEGEIVWKRIAEAIIDWENDKPEGKPS